MAQSIGSITSPAGRILVQWISRAGRDLFRTLRHRREIMALADLDDRLLKDVGLTRGDVQGALSEPLLRNPSTVLVRSAERHSRAEMTPRARAARPVVPLVRAPAGPSPWSA
jgi:uncharacterized protein YjiS (DUF1127 family)